MLKERLPAIRFLTLLFVFTCSELIADDLTGVKLSWKAPTEYSNGEQLKYANFELSEYRLYFGPSREKVRSEYVSIDPKELSFLLQQLDFSKVTSPVVYLAMTAVSKNGLESELSEIIFFLP